MIIALLFLSAIVFGLIRLSGDPSIHFLSADANEDDLLLVRAELGLDRPVYIQYGFFIMNAFKGDFGKSIFTKRPVIESIKEMLPNSIRLIFVATLIAFSVAIPLGVMAAVKKGTSIDRCARFLAGMGQSLPSFWIGLMMLQLFVIILGILPASGIGDWRHYVMPATCLALFKMPGPLRLIRSSMLECLDSEYIKLARIKGVPKRIVIWKHALRNSLLPVLSYSAMYLALSVSGTIVVETVFAWPGMGRLAYNAIITQDFPVIQGVVLLTAFIVLVANFLADILYAFVDPRIRLKT